MQSAAARELGPLQVRPLASELRGVAQKVAAAFSLDGRCRPAAGRG